MELSDRLRYLRGKLSQSAFGTLLGVSQASIGNYEKGERFPDSAFIKNVCTSFGVTADWLIFGAGENKSGNAGHDFKKIGDNRQFSDNQHVEIIENNDIKVGDGRQFLCDAEKNTILIDSLRSLADLQKANGDLRVENMEMRARIADLEREVGELRARHEP
jgi:transcriptional regulator with XRE-family HTH domain